MNSDLRSNCLSILFLLTLILTISILPIGCGGGGGNGDNNDVNPTASEGVFLDSPVAGIDYKTATQSGVTDENGIFQYITGEIVTFSIGNLELGSAIGQSILTPIDLVSGAIDESDIGTIELKDANGDTIFIEGASFWADAYYFGNWNANASNVDFSPTLDSGFSIRFNDSLTTLSPGNYTYEVTTTDGDLLTKTVYYPGEKDMPCVDDDSMAYEWQQDGSLKLTWDPPAVTDYDEIRVVFDDQDEIGKWGSLVYIKLPADADEVIIPSAQIQKIENLDDPVLVHWVVKTRSYTDDRNMYARGYSDTVSFLWDEPEASLTVTGESGNQVDLNGIWRQWCWPEYDDNESSDEATTISGSSFTTKRYEWTDTTDCSGEPWVEIVYSGTATLGSEVMIGSDFGDITVTRVDLDHDAITATVYDSDMVDELNSDTVCGYTDWAIGVSKSLMGTDCDDTAAKDIIYIDDTGDDNAWYKGCNEDDCAQDEGYPAELQHDKEKYRFF